MRKPTTREVLTTGAAGAVLAGTIGAALLHGSHKVEGHAVPVAGPLPTTSSETAHNHTPNTSVAPVQVQEAPVATTSAAPASTPKHEKKHNVPGADYQIPVLGQNIGDLYNKAKITDEVPGTAQQGVELRATIPRAGKAKIVTSWRSTIMNDPTYTNLAHVAQEGSGPADFSLTFTKDVKAPATAWNAECTDTKGNKITVTAGVKIAINTGGDVKVINNAEQAQSALTDMSLAAAKVVGQTLAEPPGSPIIPSPVEGFCHQFAQ